MRQYLNEIRKRKDLIIYLIKSGLKAEHRNSYLGYFWWLLDPLLNILVYYFLVVIVLGRGGENYAVFLVIGLVAWRWVSTTINSSARAILKYSSIINQVYLPKMIFPMTISFTQLINFVFGLAGDRAVLNCLWGGTGMANCIFAYHHNRSVAFFVGNQFNNSLCVCLHPRH